MGGINRFRPTTGLPIAPYFSASKILWILENVPGVRQDAINGDAVFGNVDAWLIYKLTSKPVSLNWGIPPGGVGVGRMTIHLLCWTGGTTHITDVTNASRTLLMNLNTMQWDQEILSTLNIPRSMLPEIRSSSEVYVEATVGVLHGE